MKSHTKLKWYIGCIVMTSNLLIAPSVYAKTMSFCVRVNAEFVDSGGENKEHYFNMPGKQSYMASYAYLTLKKVGVTEPLYEGYLDQYGCITYPVNLVANAVYRVELETHVGDGQNRRVYIPQDGSLGHCVDPYWCEYPPFVFTSNFYTDENLETTQDDTYVYTFDEISPRMNLLVLSGFLLSRAEELGYPPNTKTIIKIDGQGNCYNAGMGGSYSLTGQLAGNICAASMNNGPENPKAMSDGAYFKFVIGHEFGHRV